MTIIILIILSNQVYKRYFYIPDYHISINQNDIKMIDIFLNGKKKMISSKDGSSIINEFNKAKITRVRKLNGFENSDLVVLLIFNNGSTLNFIVKDNEIRVSRVISTKKVEYIAKSEELKNVVIKSVEEN